jgi:protein LTV1
MGKNKKPFIDRKKASTYHVLHRSERDVADGDFVLWPTGPDNHPGTDATVLQNDFASLRTQLRAAGLLDEGDQERYLKPMTGEGLFVDAKSGHVQKLEGIVATTSSVAHSNAVGEDNLLEVQRQFDSIPLTADCMEEDIAAALFGDFDELDFEELDDAFVLQASEPEPDGANVKEAFDFDAHVRQLIEKAKRARQDEDDKAGEHGRADREFFGGLQPLQEDYDDEDEDGQYYANTLDAEEEKALADLFHATLAEYGDDDEEDEINDEEAEPEIYGHVELENPMLDAVLDEFLTENPEDILMQKEDYLDDRRGAKQNKGGFSVLVGTQMVPAKDLNMADHHPEQEPSRPLEELWREADETLALPKEQPPAEEIFIDGKSYFSERERNRWDCESILTTYSNLDNNPHTVDVSEGRRRRRRQQQQQPEPDQTIRLSNKTGLAVLAQEDEEEKFDDLSTTIASVNRGVPRPRNESGEERKNRKLLVKKERELARIQKKMTKAAFDDEFRRRAGPLVHDDVAGKTVFRFA